MNGKAVAILPSNQSRNVSPIIPAYNEGGGMHYLAPLVVERCKAKGVNAAWFSAKMEHEPGQTYAHQWIVEQIARANVWLKSQGGGVMVHLHTDSGTYSHTFGIYTTRFTGSRQLATTLSTRVHTALATEQWRVFDRLGDTDYNTYLFAVRAEHTPCLIELCAHTVERDIRVLFAQPHVAAEALAAGLADYLGIASAIESKNELIEYSRWAQARLQNNEDPRDTQAFVEHLKRLGADWQNPRRYGLPYVEVYPKAP